MTAASTTCLLLALAGTVFSAGPGAAAELDQTGAAHDWQGDGSHYAVIDFAASWCAPCWDSLPRLQALTEHYPDLRILVVSVDDQKSGRDRLVQALELELPVLWDENYAIARHYQPEGMPATYVIDPAGAVVYEHIGSTQEDWDRLVKLLDRLASRTPGADSG